MQLRNSTYKMNNRGGFTLAEVMVSMSLMALVFTAAFGAHFMGMKMVDDAREEMRASQIIQSELEAMRTMNWSDLTQINGAAMVTPQGKFVSKFANNYTVYRVVGDLNANQKYVVIWVWWKNSKGFNTFRRFSSVFTQNGLNDYYYRQV